MQGSVPAPAKRGADSRTTIGTLGRDHRAAEARSAGLCQIPQSGRDETQFLRRHPREDLEDRHQAVLDVVDADGIVIDLRAYAAQYTLSFDDIVHVHVIAELQLYQATQAAQDGQAITAGPRRVSLAPRQIEGVDQAFQIDARGGRVGRAIFRMARI